MQNLEHSEVWLFLKGFLEKKKSEALEGLTVLSNTREKDVDLKARIAVIKELLDLPRNTELAASYLRKHGK